MRREAVVKGYFYPSSKDKILKMFGEWSLPSEDKNNSFIAIVPHAGYVYSGEIAFKTLSQMALKKRIILMGPNHTGFGQRVSIYPKGSWETPFGDIEIDGDLVNELVGAGFKTDTLAHMKEHSLEVIVPMVKYLKNDCKIVPITISYLRYDECEIVAEKMFEVISRYAEEINILISSDFNHFEDENTTHKKDELAIRAILDLDPKGLYDVVRDNDISMCGVIPATIGLLLSKKMGVSDAKLLMHRTSGAVSGDYDRVVGYAGILINK